MQEPSGMSETEHQPTVRVLTDTVPDVDWVRYANSIGAAIVAGSPARCDVRNTSAFNIGDRVRVVDGVNRALDGAEGTVISVEQVNEHVYEYKVRIPEEAPVYLWEHELEAVQ